MPPKMKEILKLIGYISLILFGIASGIGGAYLLGLQTLLAAGLCVLSLICLALGVAGLLKMIFVK